MPRRGLSLVLPLTACLVLAGCKDELYSKLGEPEANEMTALLLNAGIPAERILQKDGTLTVYVEDGRFADAVDLLKANGYPRQSFANMGDVFKNEGLVSSPTDDRARLIYALSQELSRTIAGIDGVLSARVHVVLPENDPLKQTATPASAAVFIRADSAASVDQLTPQIKMLVANGIAGLSYDKVSVILVPVAVRQPEAVAAPLTNIAGLWILRSSAETAKLLIAGLGAVATVCIGAVGWLLWRRTATGLPRPVSLERLR